MKAAVQTAYGPPEVVETRDLPTPVPKAGEVLVRVMAATVTSGDARLRAFRVPLGFWLPARLVLGITRPRRAVLGSEFAGVVVETGAGASKFKVGDKVFGMHVFDTHAEYKVLPETAALVPMPEGFDFGAAAAVPFGALTALYFLRLAKVGHGQKVLVNGASGAVGAYAVQLARHMGAEVTAVCSGANADLVRDLGATLVIDYTREDFSRRGQSFDVIADTADTVTMDQFRRATVPNGKLLAIGGGAGMFLRAALAPLSGRRRIVAGTAPERLADLEYLRDLLESGALRSVIDRRLPFAGIVQAHALVDSGRKRGAVVLEMTPA